MKYLLDCYEGEGVFSLKNKSIVAERCGLISGTRVFTFGFQRNAFNKPKFKVRFFPNVIQVSY